MQIQKRPHWREDFTVAEQAFEEWRAARKKGARIPDGLWQMANRRKPLPKDGPLIVECCGKKLVLHVERGEEPWELVMRWLDEVKQEASS